MPQTTTTDTVEFQLRAEIEQLKEEAGGLRIALIRVLQETPRDAVPATARAQAYRAMGGSNA